MEESAETAANKKTNLDDLNKEELIKKCKSLITIVQKAKQSKDALQEENNLLKKLVEDKSVADSDNKVIIENLTQQKLNFVSQIDELSQRLKRVEEDLKKSENEKVALDNENVHFKRQIQRLTDENETLIGHLDAQEKQVEELKALGIKQREQLLELEANCKLLEESQVQSNDYANLMLINEKLQQKVKFYHSKIVKIAGDAKSVKEEKNLVLEQFRAYISQVSCWQDKLNNIQIIYSDYIKKIESERDLFQNKLNLSEKAKKELENELEHSKVTDKQLAERSSEEIVKLVEEIRSLSQENEMLKQSLEKYTRDLSNVQTQTESALPENLTEELSILKQENTELLAEMNEMNQALKNRGETISELEIHCEEMKKKLQIYESQANKNMEALSEKEEKIRLLEEQIRQSEEQKLSEEQQSNESAEMQNKNELIMKLNEEIVKLREEVDQKSNLAVESDALSTSTISKSEEIGRLRDLEGSWEERYGKLRNLALKLKAKIRDLQKDKEDLEVALKSSKDNNNKLLEDVKEKNNYLNQLQNAAEEISKSKQELLKNQEEIEKLKREKSDTEIWKKNISLKIQTLRKEVESHNLIKKEFENKISKLEKSLGKCEKDLKNEQEAHLKTKSLLEQLNSEAKKNSVLNLEMADCERSVKDLALKVEKKDEEISKLNLQVASLTTKVDILKEQNKMLEENHESATADLNNLNANLESYKKKIRDLEETLQLKDDKILSTNQLLEQTKARNEEISFELSKIISEHQKSYEGLKAERDSLHLAQKGLQQSLRDCQNALKLKTEELESLQKDFDNYKVRAQSVLRQNQNRDVGLEEKLLNQISSLELHNSTLENEKAALKSDLEKALLENKELETLKNNLQIKYQEILDELEEIRKNYDDLSQKYQQAKSDHSETVRNLKIHSETLAKSFRQQLNEQEVRHNKEIIELQSKIVEPSSTSSPIEQFAPISVREEGEGSESIDSTNALNNNNAKIAPVPLERLLGGDGDQEVNFIKKQLNEQEAKVNYLTALLADTEQDLVKHVQMNKLLKEEIRRQQRSVEREKHAENLEYLKNVVFKFITLSSGDERSRLVPVLNTILKLSPEEMQKLNLVAKGADAKSWATYLPSWPSNS